MFFSSASPSAEHSPLYSPSPSRASDEGAMDGHAMDGHAMDGHAIPNSVTAASGKPQDTSSASTTYGYEAVQAILALALEQKGRQEEGFSRSQLLEIAAEMDLSPEDLQAAEWRWRSQERDLGERLAFDRDRRSRFQQHALRYLIVTGFLLVLNGLVTGGTGIATVIAVWWGLGLALNAQRTYGLRGDAYEKRFQRWRQRRLLRRSLGSLVGRVLQASQQTLSPRP